MKRFFSLRFLEPALAIGLALALITGARADLRQSALADKMLRLHVIANSNSEEDQALKLRVRDRVLALSETLLQHAETVSDAQRVIRENLPQLQACAQGEVARSGYSYPVTAELTHMYFPTREYESFSLPAGMYDAFRIVIGAGAGRNWWCVMFPPLCITAAEAEVTQSAEKAGLSEEEIAIIEGGGTVYRYEFKLMELVGGLKSLFSR